LPCIPWGTPTLSDSDKLEWKSGFDELTAQLALQLANSNDFSSGFGELTEVDAGANVSVAGGKLLVDGSNAWDANGVHLTIPVPKATPGRFVIKCTRTNNARGRATIGIAEGAALDRNASNSFRFATDANSSAASLTASYGFSVNDVSISEKNVTYTFECEWGAQGTAFYVTAADYYPTRTRLLACAHGHLPDNIGFEVNVYDAGSDYEFEDYERYSGYDTGGEYMQFVADAGAGLGFYGLDFSNMALPSGLTGTNLKYQYSYDDGTPSYNGSWLTLAQLQAVGAVSGNKRYIRLRVQLNSDGDTQEYGAAVNADDGISGVFVQPSSDIIAPGEVVNAVTGDMDLPELENVLNTDTLRGEAGTYSPSATTSQTKTGVRYARSGVR